MKYHKEDFKIIKYETDIQGIFEYYIKKRVYWLFGKVKTNKWEFIYSDEDDRFYKSFATEQDAKNFITKNFIAYF